MKIRLLEIDDENKAHACFSAPISRDGHNGISVRIVDHRRSQDYDVEHRTWWSLKFIFQEKKNFNIRV